VPFLGRGDINAGVLTRAAPKCVDCLLTGAACFFPAARWWFWRQESTRYTRFGVQVPPALGCARSWRESVPYEQGIRSQAVQRELGLERVSEAWLERRTVRPFFPAERSALDELERTEPLSATVSPTAARPRLAQFTPSALRRMAQSVSGPTCINRCALTAVIRAATSRPCGAPLSPVATDLCAQASGADAVRSAQRTTATTWDHCLRRFSEPRSIVYGVATRTNPRETMSSRAELDSVTSSEFRITSLPFSTSLTVEYLDDPDYTIGIRSPSRQSCRGAVLRHVFQDLRARRSSGRLRRRPRRGRPPATQYRRAFRSDHAGSRGQRCETSTFREARAAVGGSTRTVAPARADPSPAAGYRRGRPAVACNFVFADLDEDSPLGSRHCLREGVIFRPTRRVRRRRGRDSRHCRTHTSTSFPSQTPLRAGEDPATAAS